MQDVGNQVKVFAVGEAGVNQKTEGRKVSIVIPPHAIGAILLALGRLQVGLLIARCLVGAADGVGGLFALRLGFQELV